MDVDFYKPRELAEHLKISYAKMYLMIKNKEIPCYKIGGEYRLDIKMVEKWLKAQRVA